MGEVNVVRLGGRPAADAAGLGGDELLCTFVEQAYGRAVMGRRRGFAAPAKANSAAAASSIDKEVIPGLVESLGGEAELDNEIAA